jgi:hypothetical protein
MSKFKVGDKVALKDDPYNLLGCVTHLVAGCQLYYLIAMKGDKYRIASESEIVALQQLPNMSDDEIYDMLKPKMKNSNVWNHGYRVAAYDDGYHLVREENDVIKAIALAYRSGYLRAKKGRPFKIGGEKD